MWFQWVGMFGMLLLTGEFVVDFIIRMGKDDCFYSLLLHISHMLS
jgi:hypothetical protein